MRALLAFLVVIGWLVAAPVRADGRYASIIVDAHSLEVLHARDIDGPRHPASLTKIMTLYLTFEAIEAGRLSLDTQLVVSANAARTPPVKMGLKAGQRVSVETLIQAVAVRSSNDAAVVLAEALAGSELAFAAKMTDTARTLGMQRTTFRNANGLPDEQQITTARDMAKLAHATLSRFPQHYHYFGQEEFRGRKSTNALLSQPGVDGFKTGYTRASGHNLVISAVRDIDGRERRLFAVVLGGASKTSRNTHMSELIERGFEVMGQIDAAPPARSTRTVRRDPLPATRELILASTAASWAVQIGGYRSPAEASIHAESLLRAAGAGRVAPRRGFTGGQPVFSARVEGLTDAQARRLCADHAAILGTPARRCLVVSGG